MKAIVAVDVNRLEMREREIPSPGPEQILLKVAATGLCQTDLDVLQGHRHEPDWQPPRVLGHEISGTVCQMGAGVTGLASGQRVVINPVVSCGECFYCKKGVLGCEHGRLIGGSTDGGLQEYVCVPAKNAVPIPEGVPFEMAAFLEPFACVLTAFRKAVPSPGDTVVISGPGIGGLCFVQLCKSRGARVILTGTKDERLALGRKLGADITVNILREDALDLVLRETGGRGADIAFEASGSAKAFPAIQDMTRTAGTIVVYGVSSQPLERFDLLKLVLKDHAVLSGAGPWQTFPQAVELVARGKVILDPFLTHTFAPEQAEEAFALLKARVPGLIKAVIRWP